MNTSGIRLARALALASTSTVALLAGALMPAYAQTAPAQTAQAPAVEEIVVTGSRIVRDGYEAPTPVSVLGAEELNAMANANIADSITKLPAFTGSQTQRTGAVNLSSGAAGVNLLNLRGLGSQRVLVLLDGKRVINAGLTAGYTGADTNTMPQGLITRVDVVTGGASAAYGSDALSGVVNFVLDKEFVGIKGDVQGGVSTYGDDRNWGVNLASGTAFADGRGHLLLSGELNYNDGIRGAHRPFNNFGGVVTSNPARTATNGLPNWIAGDHTGMQNAMPGGLITRCTVPGAPAGTVCPLKGIYFGPGGVPLTFNYGTLSSGNLMTGGDWQASRVDDGVDYDPQIERQNAYARASYDIADSVTIHGELQYGRSHSVNTNNINRLIDQVVILTGNPFIPTQIQAQMTALKLTSIIMGTTSGDVGRFVADNVRQLRRWSVGGDGKFDAFGSTWTWDAYWQTTMEGLSSRIRNSGMVPHIANATDSVRGANGQIICRSTLTNPTDGCVPFNFFGQGVNSQAAINYFVGVSFRYDTLRQHIGSFTVNGEPFSTWAGPVSLATGVEHRQESAKSANTPDDDANNFLAGDFKRTLGQFDVNEGFIETVIPLAKDAVWAKSLDMSAAARFTSYSTSGYVTTWKVGANWQFIDDIRVRATRSRDIRAAYLGELYSGGDQAGANTFQDPFTGTATANGYSIGKGNPTLKPEKADTTGLGVVLSPQFFPGFNFSADYYNIDIAGAVAQPNAQGMINACFAGNTVLCANITRQGPPIPNNPTGLSPIYSVTVSPQNVAQQIVRGIDFESSYRVHMSTIVDSWDGDLSLRALMNYVLHVSTYDPTLAANQYVDGRGVIGGFGVPGFSGLTSPRYRMTASARYTTDTIGVGLTMRYVASGVYNNALTECSSGCPNSTNTINNNHIDSNTVYDLSLSYKPFHDASANTEFFLSIQNLLNQAPPFIAGGNSGSYYSGQNIRGYDVVGRFFTAGVRFKM